MKRDDYLARIGVEDTSIAADLASLKLLQRQHLLNVPFENLDIHWKRPIILDIEKFYEKIVGENRGGFCYELNGLFNNLLQDIGFQTRLVSARVFNGTDHGPEFDHAAIIVTIDDEEYLADVGFGAFTAAPLRFVLYEEQQDETGVFTIRQFEGGHLDVAKKDADGWKSQYLFKDIARELSEFAVMCDFQQYSPDSHFKKGKLCSLMTENGRRTLTDDKLIITTNGQKEEISVTSEEVFDLILREDFGINRPY